MLNVIPPNIAPVYTEIISRVLQTYFSTEEYDLLAEELGVPSDYALGRSRSTRACALAAYAGRTFQLHQLYDIMLRRKPDIMSLRQAYTEFMKDAGRYTGEPRRPLKVFLCHSSDDRPIIGELCESLLNSGIEPWLDEKKLLPGQDWELEIKKAVRSSDVILVCLSKQSVGKTGYVQKEMQYVLDVASEHPEGQIFLIPVKLEDCKVPERLLRWQWVDLSDNNGFRKLVSALQTRAMEINTIEPTQP